MTSRTRPSSRSCSRPEATRSSSRRSRRCGATRGVGRRRGGVRRGRVPAGLQALIGSRLDRLSAAERRIVSSAAVVGDVFWLGTIAHLEGNGTDIESVLDALEGRDLIRLHPSSAITDEREYAFNTDSSATRPTAGSRSRSGRAPRAVRDVDRQPSRERARVRRICAYHLEQACRIASDLAFGDAVAPMIPAANAMQRAAKKAEARDGFRARPSASSLAPSSCSATRSPRRGWSSR